MSEFQILCVTMHQNDFSKIKEMNVHSDIVYANQCDHTSFEEIKFERPLSRFNFLYDKLGNQKSRFSNVNAIEILSLFYGK